MSKPLSLIATFRFLNLQKWFCYSPLSDDRIKKKMKGNVGRLILKFIHEQRGCPTLFCLFWKLREEEFVFNYAKKNPVQYLGYCTKSDL